MRRKSQIATILTFIIAIIFLFIVITINMGRVSKKKTMIDNACDSAGLMLASGLGSISNALRQELGLYGDTPYNTEWDLVLLGGLAAIVISVLIAAGSILVTGGIATPVAIGLVIVAAGGLMASGFSGYQAIVKEPGIMREQQAKFQNLTAEQRLFEVAMQQALFNTIDDSYLVPDRFDVDRDGLKSDDTNKYLDKISRVNHWYFQRLNSLPRVGDIVAEFYRYLFEGTYACWDPALLHKAKFEVDKDPETWEAKSAYLVAYLPDGSSLRVADWLNADFRIFAEKLARLGYPITDAVCGIGCQPPGGPPNPPPEACGEFAWPLGSRDNITCLYGWGCDTGCDYYCPGGVNKFHSGLDIALACETDIHASAAGDVVFAGENGGYGNLIIIDHNNGYSTYYAHAHSLVVGLGPVEQGQLIAKEGTTGTSTGCHVHFEIRTPGLIDPLSQLECTEAQAPHASPVYAATSKAGGVGGCTDGIDNIVKDIRNFDKEVKSFYGMSKDERIAAFETWYGKFYNLEKDGTVDKGTWYYKMGKWAEYIDLWANEMSDEIQPAILSCVGTCKYNEWVDTCTADDLCSGGTECKQKVCDDVPEDCCDPWPSCGGSGTCDPEAYCHWDSYSPARYKEACCGEEKTCGALCGDEHCSPPASSHKCTTECGDIACCSIVDGLGTRGSCTTQLQFYIDRLELIADTIRELQNEIRCLYEKWQNEKQNNLWTKVAIYAWKDVAGKETGQYASPAIQPQSVAHLVFVKLEFAADYKFPYVTQERKWWELGLVKYTYVKSASGQFYITVGRYDEDMAKQGPLSNFWRFKFRRFPETDELSFLNSLQTVAGNFAAKLNDGGSCINSPTSQCFDELISFEDFALLSAFAEQCGIVARDYVNYGPGWTYTKEQIKNHEYEAKKINRDIKILQRIR